jgi:hypothetical protein
MLMAAVVVVVERWGEREVARCFVGLALGGRF